MIKQISVGQAQQMIEQQQALIVDIRDPASFANGHIEGAVRIDNGNIGSFVEEADKSKPLIVVCYHGNSSQPATQVFNEQGFEGHSLIGGMAEWSITQPIVQS
ncbi:MAG: thiosulfate sulfurtransferase GlpE [Kangiellaceae bacterium]|jgi:thiosulfate sulfurtransferase